MIHRVAPKIQTGLAKKEYLFVVISGQPVVAVAEEVVSVAVVVAVVGVVFDVPVFPSQVVVAGGPVAVAAVGSAFVVEAVVVGQVLVAGAGTPVVVEGNLADPDFAGSDLKHFFL